MAEKFEAIELVDASRSVKPDITIVELKELAEDTETLERIIKNAKEISILIIGKTGTGKSTLVNGLVGEEVAEVQLGLTTAGVTKEVKSYHRVIDEVDVKIFDSPGLQDGSSQEDAYLNALKKECCNVYLIIFAIRMSDNRFVPNNPDAIAMVKFTKKFGPSIWNRTIVAITCANSAEILNPQVKKMSPDKKKEFFQSYVEDYKKVIHRTLINDAHVPEEIATKVKVVPTGYEDEAKLMDGTLWFSNFWLECFTSIPTSEGRMAMLKLNAKRLKPASEVKNGDFSKLSLPKQPIIIPESKVSTDKMVAGALFGPACIGALIGLVGLVAGPIGLVGVPFGLLAGMVVGGIALAASSEKKKS